MAIGNKYTTCCQEIEKFNKKWKSESESGLPKSIQFTIKEVYLNTLNYFVYFYFVELQKIA